VIEWAAAIVMELGRLRAVLCAVLGHRFEAVRRVTKEYKMITVYQCDRCGVER